MLGIRSATIGVLLTKPLSSAVKAEVDKRKDRSEVPNLLSSRSIRICFLSTPVKAISAITVSSEGLTAALYMCLMPMNPESSSASTVKPKTCMALNRPQRRPTTMHKKATT